MLTLPPPFLLRFCKWTFNISVPIISKSLLTTKDSAPLFSKCFIWSMLFHCDAYFLIHSVLEESSFDPPLSRTHMLLETYNKVFSSTLIVSSFKVISYMKLKCYFINFTLLGSQTGGIAVFFRDWEDAYNFILSYFSLYWRKNKLIHFHISIMWNVLQFQDLACFRSFLRLAVCHIHMFSHHCIQKLRIPAWQFLHRGWR